MNHKIEVGIIIGGSSVEHEISLISGLQAHLEMDDTKYNSTLFYLDKNNRLYVGNILNNIDSIKDNIIKKLKEVFLFKEEGQLYYSYLKKPKHKYPIDIFIPVVHGYGMEDGTLSGYLDMYEAIYTSSKVIPSSIVQDKVATKALLDKYQIPNIKYEVLFENSENQKINLTYPVIIKPAYLGSSIGIKIVKNDEEFYQALNNAYQYCDKVLVEEALDNYLEYNCACFMDHFELITSDIEEVKHQKEILSFFDKYETSEKNRIIPANISSSLDKEIRNTTKDIYLKFNLSGVIRVDYLYDLKNNRLYVNEINNIPGSLAYYLYEGQNIAFKELLNILIQNAMIEHHKLNSKRKTFESNVLNIKANKLFSK